MTDRKDHRRMRLWTLLITHVAMIMMWLASPAMAQPAQTLAVPEYTLGAGDRVAVTVFRHTDLSGEFEVDGAGRITLPLLGQLPVLGYSARQVEAAITGKLRPDYLRNPSVSVQVLSYRPFYIVGEVKQPGSYPYVNGMTVIQAVALAGGFTYRAKEDKVLIQRATDETQAKRPARQADPVLPGDIVEVPERFF
jgi:protein involved in polysaccharide export with SLBB domain